MKELSKEQIKAQAEYIEHLKTLHAQWLEHPITKQCIKNLEFFKEIHVQALNALVSDRGVDANFYRAQGMNVKNCDAVLIKILHTETFVNDILLQQQPK